MLRKEKLKSLAISTSVAYAKGEGWKSPTNTMRRAVEDYFEATHSNCGMSLESVYLARKITAGELVIDLISRLNCQQLAKVERGLMEIASEIPAKCLKDDMTRKSGYSL